MPRLVTSIEEHVVLATPDELVRLRSGFVLLLWPVGLFCLARRIRGALPCNAAAAGPRPAMASQFRAWSRDHGNCAASPVVCHRRSRMGAESRRRALQFPQY